MAGFMDFFDTDQARLGMGLLAAAGPRADGAGFGQRLMEGVGSLDQWKQDKQRSQYIKAKMEEQSAQADQRRAKAAQEQALLERDAAKRAALPGLFSQGSAGAPAFNVDDALPSFMRTGSAPQPAVAPRRAGIDVQGALSAGYTAEEITKLDGLRNIGQDKVARTLKGIGPDGREYEYQTDEFGRTIGNGLAQWKAPVFNDGGGQTNVIDPYNPLKPIGSLPKTMTFSDKNAAATLKLSRERLSFDQNGGADGGGTTQVQFNKQFGKAPAGYRWTPSGGMEFIPGGPADQKAQAQKGGEGTVGGVVADLRDKYTQLDAENGIVSTNNRFGTNIGAYIGASGVGQGVNGMFGTKTQSARDSIAMTRPLLLQSIMKATGMSAKQMDSNAELKLYLATATDPQKGLEANLEALDRIESLYGGGNEKFKAPTKQAATVNGWSLTKE